MASGRSTPSPWSSASFAAALVGLFLTPVIWAGWQTFTGEVLASPSWIVTGGSVATSAIWALLWGGLAARVGRRLPFYEVAAAGLIFTAALLLLSVRVHGAVEAVAQARGAGALRGHLAAVLATGTARNLSQVVSAWAIQGKLVLVLGLVLVGSLSGTLLFIGASIAYLLGASSRYDPSISYELFVARSHLRFSARTLLALFGLVVTGILPGLLAVVAFSFTRDLEERAAVRRGEPVQRRRLPATLLMTLISIAGVAIGVWALTVVLSVMSGFEADLKQKILGANAHGVVLKYGEGDFTEWREVRRKVLEVPGVTGASPFLYSEVMVSADKNLTGAILRGIDASTIGTVTDLPRAVDEGDLANLDHPERIPPARFGATGARSADDLFDDGGKKQSSRKAGDGAPPAEARKAPALPGIVIGRELARSLRISVGEVVNVVSPFGDLGPAGPQPKSRAFRVAAVVFTGMYEYDSKFAYIALPEAQRFFGAGDSVNGLELKVRDVDAARATMRRVLTALEGYPYRAKDWGELNRNLFAALMMEKVVMAVILGFIVLVASFTIVATLIMLVLEKTREIAVLKSMGAGLPSIMKVFVLEGMAIGGVGTVFGLILGYGTCLMIDKVGIPLNPEVYYISNLPVLVDPAQFGLVALAAMVLSYLATLYPAVKASRLHPVDGLRSE